jgi:hypothetical protein
LRTAWSALAIALFAIFLASGEAFAIFQVIRGHGAEISFVNVYGFAVTWIDACITGAVGCVVVLSAFAANAIYRWRREHGY